MSVFNCLRTDTLVTLHENDNETLGSIKSREHFVVNYLINDRHCGLVVRVLGYRSGGPGSIPGTTRKKKE
jgi:hypothetical protein